MSKLAVFYHCRVGGGQNPPLNEDYACSVMGEQMRTFEESGLANAAEHIGIYSNGGLGCSLVAAQLAPPKALVIDNGAKAESILPTVCRLRDWLPDHRDWLVCFWHTKGVTHANDALNQTWRRCMERHVISNWDRCVKDLERGFDSVGAHWLTRERFGPQVVTPFWGGMFFWATARFLLTLPGIPEKPSCRDDWFKAEGWIGMGQQRPKVIDYAPHWPALKECGGR